MQIILLVIEPHLIAFMVLLDVISTLTSNPPQWESSSLIMSSYLDCCRCEYVKMQSREDSLWESFPQAIKTCEGAGRYINAFWTPFQGLPL